MVFVALVTSFLALALAAVAAVSVLRDEPANTGPAPTLPEYSPPTSLAPVETTTAPPQTSAPPATVGADDADDADESPDPTVPALQATMVVDPAGGADFTDLQQAIDAAAPGEIIEVRGGEYQAIVIRYQGDPDNWLRIVGQPDNRPVVRTKGSGLSSIELDGATFVEVSGFETTSLPDSIHGSGVRIVNGSHHIRVTDNIVHDMGGNGIEIIEAGTVAVVDNEVFGNSKKSTFQTSGISIFKPLGDDGEGYENVISGNRVYDNENLVPNDFWGITDGNCIIVDNTRWPDGSYDYPGSTLIENNVCFDNGGRGVHILKSDDVYVVNNTMYQNLRTSSISGGELSAHEAVNVRFNNNLVWPRSDAVLWLVASESVGFDNNLYVLPESSRDSVEPTAVLTDDPRLVNPSIDPAVADFSPLAASPAAGAGSPADAPPVDFNGQARLSPPSVGAIEALLA